MRFTQKELETLLHEREVDLNGTIVRIVRPSKRGIINRLLSTPKDALSRTFLDIEDKIRDRADPHYEPFENFREVGGYFLIRTDNGDLSLEETGTTEGSQVSNMLVPGIGFTLAYSCPIPSLEKLNPKLDNVIIIARYHSHPYDSHPHPQDIVGVISDVLKLPSNIRFLQAVYHQSKYDPFTWIEHIREN